MGEEDRYPMQLFVQQLITRAAVVQFHQSDIRPLVRTGRDQRAGPVFWLRPGWFAREPAAQPCGLWLLNG